MNSWNQSFKLLKSIHRTDVEAELSKSLWSILKMLGKKIGKVFTGKGTKPPKSELKVLPGGQKPSPSKAVTQEDFEIIDRLNDMAKKIIADEDVVVRSTAAPITKKQIATSKVVNLERVKAQKARDFLKEIKISSEKEGLEKLRGEIARKKSDIVRSRRSGMRIVDEPPKTTAE